MARKDILLQNDDLQIRGGDFVVGESDLQHVYLIIRLAKGNIKQFPLIGVGEERFLNGTIDGNLRRELQLQLESDGYRPRKLGVNGTQIEVEL